MSDSIDRQAAIDAICEHGTDLERRGITVLAVANHKQVTVDLLESLPSADASLMQDRCKIDASSEERKGKWIPSDVPESTLCMCDQCGFGCGAYCFNFCPNCGARMKGEEDG